MKNNNLRNKSKNVRNRCKNVRNLSKNVRNKSKNVRNKSTKGKNNFSKKSLKNLKIIGGADGIAELLDDDISRVDTNNSNIQLNITISSPDIELITDKWSVDPNGSLDQLYNLCKEELEENLSNYIVTINLANDKIAIFKQGKIKGGENISILEQGIETDSHINIILEKFLPLKEYLNNLSEYLLKNLIFLLSGGSVRTSYKDTKKVLINKFVILLQKELEVDGIEEMNIFDIINEYKKELEKNKEFYFPKLGIDQQLRKEYQKLSRDYQEYEMLHDYDPDPYHIQILDDMNDRLRQILGESI